MELVEGKPLGDVIGKEGVPLARLLQLAIPLADARCIPVLVEIPLRKDRIPDTRLFVVCGREHWDCSGPSR